MKAKKSVIKENAMNVMETFSAKSAEQNALLNTYNVPVGFNGTTWNVFSSNDGVLTTTYTVSGGDYENAKIV